MVQYQVTDFAKLENPVSQNLLKKLALKLQAVKPTRNKLH